MASMARKYQTAAVRRIRRTNIEQEMTEKILMAAEKESVRSVLARKCFIKAAKDQSNTRKYRVVRQESYFALESSSGERFGMLDMHTTRTLHCIQDFPAIRFYAVVNPSSRIIEGLNARCIAQNKLIEASINVYGASGCAANVGDALGQNKQFLQHPCAVDPGVDYENPQYLTLPGASAILNDLVQVPPEESSMSDAITFEVNQIMDTLEQVDCDHDTSQSSHILTPLQRHQHVALAFIQKREALSKSDFLERSRLVLPRSQDDSNGNSPIVHVVPSAAGLLADDVGLGKTLTMLSAIVSSLEEAASFATVFEQELLHQQMPQRTRATLVIVPSAQLIDVWNREIEFHLAPGTLELGIFLGADRANDAEELMHYDLILTTYSTMVKDFQQGGPLHELHWFRIILDEAHWIRNQKTQQFRAAGRLRAERRWCLTATPIHNKLEDLAALLDFLHIEPFHGKGSTSAFQHYILDPLISKCEDPCRNLRALLQKVCLRRAKEGHSNIKATEHTLTLKMSSMERNLYDSTLERTKIELDMRISNLPNFERYAK
ncbi:MAG: hypothetical protein Q9220_007432, partial [cf. Caloplaca sp. 1 TL-2023]